MALDAGAEQKTRSGAPTALLSGIAAIAGLTIGWPIGIFSTTAVGEWVAVGIFLLGAIPLSVIDARTMRLPNRGTFPLAAAIAGHWIGLSAATADPRVFRALACGAGLLAVGLIISFLGTLALGDVKLLLAIGILTGWFTWLLPLSALIAGYLIALPHASILLIRKRQDPTRTTHLPFGPYLAAGATLCVILTLFTSRP